MPVLNSIAGLADDMKEWRQWLHRHPELSLDLPVTAGYVADRLRSIGVDELHEGIAQTGMVAIINGQGDGPTIGLRADMDALPIHEATGAEYASLTPGQMHACGHDGHTAMLLGAAAYLAETRRFRGRVALIFQPAEETIGGARIMVEEGILDRFDVANVFAIHNSPNVPLGHFAVTDGPAMAAADEFSVVLTGKGGHAARPEMTNDPLLAAAAIVQALQTVPARDRAGHEPFVLSVTQMHAGGAATNVIGAEARLAGTVRSYSDASRQMAQTRIDAIVNGTAAAFGVGAALSYERGYPPTVNNAAAARFAAETAVDVVGPDAVDTNPQPRMGSEDFAYMLNERPGAYVWLGQGFGPGLHQPTYDFDDTIAPIGASFLARLVERANPLVSNGNAD